jgi:hypothetical protein
MVRALMALKMVCFELLKITVFKIIDLAVRESSFETGARALR